jgi:hypothetical protein
LSREKRGRVMERIGVTWNNLVATMGRRIENHGKDAGMRKARQRLT